MNFMPKVYKATEILKMLLSYGFQKVSQKWSHLKLQNQTWEIVMLPIHSKDIPYWTFVSIETSESFFRKNKEIFRKIKVWFFIGESDFLSFDGLSCDL